MRPFSSGLFFSLQLLFPYCFLQVKATKYPLLLWRSYMKPLQDKSLSFSHFSVSFSLPNPLSLLSFYPSTSPSLSLPSPSSLFQVPFSLSSHASPSPSPPLPSLPLFPFPAHPSISPLSLSPVSPCSPPYPSLFPWSSPSATFLPYFSGFSDIH